MLKHRGCDETPAGAVSFLPTSHFPGWALIWQNCRVEKPVWLFTQGGVHIIASGLTIKITFGRQVVFEGKLGNIFLPCKYLPLDNGIISEDLL